MIAGLARVWNLKCMTQGRTFDLSLACEIISRGLVVAAANHCSEGARIAPVAAVAAAVAAAAAAHPPARTAGQPAQGRSFDLGPAFEIIPRSLVVAAANHYPEGARLALAAAAAAVTFASSPCRPAGLELKHTEC